MKTIISNLVKNALEDVLTSAAGTIIGLPEIIKGVSTHDWYSALEGLCAMVMGFAINLKK